jgi:hypothetical protein
MNETVLKLIQITHLLLILFVIITPFTNNVTLLMLHVIIIPFLYGHWITNSNKCALTMMEKDLRKKLYGTINENDCFTCQLITPVYDFNKNYDNMSNFIYFMAFFLWVVSIYKVYYSVSYK